MINDSTNDTPASLQVDIWRGEYRRYTVPRRDNQTVLDVVSYVQRELDPSLSYRFACRVGMCGSCAMTVNGRPRWTCRSHVSKVSSDGRLTLAPLANLPPIKDLVADLTPFFERWQQARGRFEAALQKNDPLVPVEPESAERRAADAAIECINCLLRRLRPGALAAGLSWPGRA